MRQIDAAKAIKELSTTYRLTTSTNNLDYSDIQKITFEHS